MTMPATAIQNPTHAALILGNSRFSAVVATK